jgi:glycerol-3-phosphate O-acyltransferase
VLVQVDPERVARASVERVIEAIERRALDGAPSLREVLRDTLYAERRRLERSRDGAELALFTGARRDLERSDDDTVRALARALVARYVGEIAGRFDPRTYAVATRVVPRALGVVLGGAGAALAGGLRALEQRLVVSGEVEALRALVRRGPVVLASTHASYLDPLVAGWALHTLGLPPFACAAARPLFEHPIVGPFVRRLGAYSVDDDKASVPLYREALVTYATLVLEHGGGDLVFPAGVRSASGAIERRPKLGLLGTALPALRALASRREDARAFVVPCTISYPLVLEAETRVESWLELVLGARHVPRADEFATTRRWLSFLRGLATADLRIHVVIGRALDPFGDDVDAHGGSHDPRGRPIEPTRYLLEAGALTEDPARDAEYTRMLATRVVEAWRRDVVPIATDVAAYAVFERLHRDVRARDLAQFLGDARDASLAENDAEEAIARLLVELRARASEGALRPTFELDAPTTLARAIRTFSTYHERPVLVREHGRVRVGDPGMLAFYRNRLDGYELLGARARVASREEVAR